ALTELNVTHNYRALKIDPGRADALILSHGHVDHYGALAPLVDKGAIKSGLTLYAGGEDTFCRRVVTTPAGQTEMGQLDAPGLVVITSCGHAGVINSVRQAQKATGVQKVHAIVGGFHLAPASDEIVDKTVQAFKAIDPDYVIPEHCTGLNTIMAVHREMPKKLVMPSTGTRVTF